MDAANAGRYRRRCPGRDIKRGWCKPMGDIADMIIEGILCECCGCFIGDPVGYPRTCEDCEEIKE